MLRLSRRHKDTHHTEEIPLNCIAKKKPLKLHFTPPETIFEPLRLHILDGRRLALGPVQDSSTSPHFICKDLVFAVARAESRPHKEVGSRLSSQFGLKIQVAPVRSF